VINFSPRAANMTAGGKSKAVRQARQKVTIADLPFPGGKNSQVWRKFFIPPLIAWAGSQLDPFGTNSRVDGEAAVIWKRVFPAVSLQPDARELLRSVVRISESSHN
jgi:hypothetical protein